MLFTPLMSMMISFTDDVRLEKAARTHTTWVLNRIGGRLNKAHELWEVQIQKALKDEEPSMI